jgi:hypothetical protein
MSLYLKRNSITMFRVNPRRQITQNVKNDIIAEITLKLDVISKIIANV